MSATAEGPPALLLISTRPALCRPGAAPAVEAVLPVDWCVNHNVVEWQWPAFHLHISADAPTAMAQWFTHCRPVRSVAPETPRMPATSLASDWVVVVSPGALALLQPLFPPVWPRTVQLGLMGDGSAALARRLGLPEECLIYPRQALQESQDSAALLERLAEAPTPRRILLLKGNAGNPSLAAGLHALSPAVTVLEAYQRQPQRLTNGQIAALRQQVATGYAVLYLTSSEAVGLMLPALVGLPTDRLRVLVTHARIQAAAQAAGWPTVECIAPGSASLKAALQTR